MDTSQLFMNTCSTCDDDRNIPFLRSKSRFMLIHHNIRSFNSNYLESSAIMNYFSADLPHVLFDQMHVVYAFAYAYMHSVNHGFKIVHVNRFIHSLRFTLCVRIGGVGVCRYMSGTVINYL